MLRVSITLRAVMRSLYPSLVVWYAQVESDLFDESVEAQFFQQPAEAGTAPPGQVLLEAAAPTPCAASTRTAPAVGTHNVW